MTAQRTLEQIEVEVKAAVSAMLPHLSPKITDDDAARVFKAKHPKLAEERARAVIKRDVSKILLQLTGCEPDDDNEARISIEVDGQPILLPRYIVKPGETDDLEDARYLPLPSAKVRHHRMFGEWMVRAGYGDAGREQLAVNAELLRRAGGNQDATIGGLLVA